MKPILFSIGPIHIYSYGTLIALGVIIALSFMNRLAQSSGDRFPSKNQVFDMVFLTLISGFIGARLFYVFQKFDWYRQHPMEIPALWQGGLVFYGGLISAFLALIIYMKRSKIHLGEGFDFLMPFVALVHAFGRLGCFFNGCCYGKLCSLPWAVHVDQLGYSAHPTQLYEALFNIGLFAFLIYLYPRRKFLGQIALNYFFFYAVGRFTIEFFRAENPGWAMMTWNQWLSIAIGFAAVFFYTRFRKHSEGVN